ncbi:transcription termination factor MTERF2, chloroplastic-like [Pyrus x bretschneideri]|uniref:transcription termination factor MTERF2, chloroplastic-like n=1 Tax=Pyrus x bretschneideri TaxID=225117 RepID=UPI000511734F|nr:transcription termination factor MTERF2, chloroplastic-like [Pyrus x bretschneideri]
MAALFNLKAGRLGYSLFSKTTRFVVGDVKPSHFTLQNQILCRRFTSEISENHHDFTVNYLINSCGLSPQGAISASKRVKLRSPERADSVLSFLRSHGVSATQISKIVRSCPGLLNWNPEKTLLPKLEFFISLGVSREDLAKTLAYETHILATSLEKRILPTCQFLRNLLSEKNFVVLLKNGGLRIFSEGHSKNVAPNIEILREFGMPQSCISLLLAYFPRSLTQKPENFAKVVDEVKQMGFDMEKSRSVAAIKALSSGNSKSIWSRNCEAYKRWGWSEDDVLSTFKRFPPCMTKSEKKIMQVMDFLVNKMGWPQRSIVKCPTIVSFSLEKRIIPRCSVVKVLLLKGLIKEIENVSLYYVMNPTEKGFLQRFVVRYIDEVPALLSVYRGQVEIQDV